MNKIYLDHVSYVYSKGTPYEQVALDDVSVGIREGCITGIIGHTGSGKSTMMQMLNGLIKPNAGRVLLDGYDINSTVTDVYNAWSEREEYKSLSPRKRKKKMQDKIRELRSKLCFRSWKKASTLTKGDCFIALSLPKTGAQTKWSI